jgi:hypothetical protein
MQPLCPLFWEIRRDIYSTARCNSTGKYSNAVEPFETPGGTVPYVAVPSSVGTISIPCLEIIHVYGAIRSNL